jgi:hypothetical protein
MGKHSLKNTGKPLTRQEIINMRRDLLAEHRKKCGKGQCHCSLAQADLPDIPNE